MYDSYLRRSAGFLCLPLFWTKCWDASKLKKFVTLASHTAAQIEIHLNLTSPLWTAQNFLYNLSCMNPQMQIPCPLFQGTTTHQSSAIFILLSEGQTDEVPDRPPPLPSTWKVMSVFVLGQLKAVKSHPISPTRKAGSCQAPRRVYPISSTAMVHVCIPIKGADASGRAV
jgi:hypothetical protein